MFKPGYDVEEGTNDDDESNGVDNGGDEAENVKTS